LNKDFQRHADPTTVIETTIAFNDDLRTAPEKERKEAYQRMLVARSFRARVEGRQPPYIQS